MVILINTSPNPFKVEYRDGTKAFVKSFPSNAVVAMKGLDVTEQISNRDSLARNGVTMYNFERNTFYGDARAMPTGSTLPYKFIGDNVKPTAFTTVSSTGFSGTTTASGMTLTANAIPASTVYGFITSANTLMASGAVSAVTIGNNTYISFSGETVVSTRDWHSAILSGAPLPVGVTVTDTSTAHLGSGTTFYLSASTVQTRAGYEYLKRLV